MFDVTVLGLGPVGCTTALFLAEAGLKVAVVERDEEVYRLPRAVNLDGEIIRAFQKIGRGQTIADLMQAVRPGERAGFAGPDREWLFGQEVKSFGINGWQPMNMFDQPELEGYLRSEALGHPNVSAFMGKEASSLNTGDTSVSVELSGATQTIDSQYLIGCDGASSSVRRSLGITSTNLGYDADWLVVDVIVSDTHTLNYDTVQVCDPDRITTYVCTKDPFRRWEFKMLPGETREEMLDPEKVMSLIDPWTPRSSYEIRRAAVYQFHASVADEWQRGRIFLAGDAAHQTPPFLGQGMNAGMRAAINLSWKIPMVVKGTASEALLESYQAERQDHAHDLIDWAVSIGKLMDHMTETFLAKREGWDPPIDDNLQQSGYGQGRGQPPVADGIIMTEQVAENSSTGFLFRQPIVTTGGSVETHLDDLMGTGFTIVYNTPQQPTLNDEARNIVDSLDFTMLSLDQLELVKGKFDPLFETHSAVIVRPDRLVFGHTTETLSLNDLVIALGSLLNITT